jgi:MerR family transcriptional regulator/heat shock protein HspR
VYSVGEVAERLGVHWRTLHNWERAGLVSPARAGGRRVYSERDLAELRRALFLTRAERFSPRAAAQIVRLERRVAELEAHVAEHERRHLTTAAAS